MHTHFSWGYCSSTICLYICESNIILSILFSISSISINRYINKKIEKIYFTIILDRAHNVTIYNKNKQLRADSQHEFTCEALGSRPAAVLTWWLDEEQFEPQFNKVQIVSITDYFLLHYIIKRIKMQHFKSMI